MFFCVARLSQPTDSKSGCQGRGRRPFLAPFLRANDYDFVEKCRVPPSGYKEQPDRVEREANQMNNFYHISMVGGPWDGVEVDVPEFPLRLSLSLPARPDGDHWDTSKCSMPASKNCCAYLLTRSRYVQADGGAAVHLRYDFLSFEPHSDRAVKDRLAPTGWRSALVQHLQDYRQRFAAWLLAPVDYPLDFRRLCPAEGAGAACPRRGDASRTEHEALSRSARSGRIATKHR
jgi:hypothetical protein